MKTLIRKLSAFFIIILFTLQPLYAGIGIGQSDPFQLNTIRRPLIDLSNESLDFGQVLLGQHEELTLTITNGGNTDLTIVQISIVGEYFSTDFNGEFSLVPEETYDLIVTFAPGESGEFPGTIIITSDDPDRQTSQVSLTGIGIGDIYVPQDYGTIQAAINASIDGIRIFVSAGTYDENIDFIGKEIVVVGNPGDPFETIIDGGGDGPVVKFVNGETENVVLSGFTITNGLSDDGGGMRIRNSGPTISRCVITGNATPGGHGGGIYCWEADPTLIDCEISQNHAAHSGGAIKLIRTSLILEHCTIADNDADQHGGGFHCEDNCTISMTNSIMWGNEPESIYFHGMQNPSIITITYSDIEGGFRGIVDNNNARVNWYNGTFDLNPLFADPQNGDYYLTPISPCIDNGDPNSPDDPDGTRTDIGAFYFEGGRHPGIIRVPQHFETIYNAINASIDGDSVLVAHGTYYENIGFFGKNIALIGDPDDPRQVVINAGGSGRVVLFANGENNSASLMGFTLTNANAPHGSGIYCNASSPTISHCIVEGNIAQTSGAGIDIRGNRASVIISHCEFKNNRISTEEGQGAGIITNRGANSIIEYCLISENTAGQSGGGVCVYSQANSVVRYCQITNNTALYSGAGISVVDRSHLRIENTTINNNIVVSQDYGGGGIGLSEGGSADILNGSSD